MTTGELPHEFLLRVARGEEIDGHIQRSPNASMQQKLLPNTLRRDLQPHTLEAAIRPKSVRELSDAFLEHVAAGANPAAYGTP